MDHKDDRDDSFFQDERDIEIIDLNEVEGAEGGDAAYETETHTTSERKTMPSARRSSLDARYTPRQRRTQMIVTASIVLLLLLVLVGSYAPARNTLVSKLVPPVATPTTMAVRGINNFYIDANPPWGHLFVDGKLIAHLPQLGIDAPLVLSQGQHLFQWIAAPFNPLQCTLSTPPNFLVDTCHYDEFIQSNKGSGGWLLNFSLSLANLPRTAYSSLVQTTQAALDARTATETVLPGETYATQQASAVARQPLKATFRLQLDLNTSSDATCGTLFEPNTSCAYRGQDCHLFCAASNFFGIFPALADKWSALGVIHSAWDYTTLSGKVVAQNEPDISATSTLYEYLMPLQISWDGTNWHVMPNVSNLPNGLSHQFDPICNAAMNNVQINSSLGLVHKNFTTNWNYVSGSNPAAGCLGIVSLYQGPTPISTQSPAYCLHRFGVFIAANAVAHEFWPHMPVADAYERQLVWQLVAQDQDASDLAPNGSTIG